MTGPAAAQSNGAGDAGSRQAAEGYRRVLVAYDGSPSAQDALALAARLRDPAGGALTLACIVPSRPWRHAGGAATGAGTEAMLTEARAELPAGIPVALRAPTARGA